MAINEDKIRKLIEGYEGYREECLDACTITDTARAGLYSAVIDDLKELLPRQTLAEVAGGDLEPYLGTWVEYWHGKGLVFRAASGHISAIDPVAGEVFSVHSDHVYPIDIPRVWDEDGELAY